MTWHATMNRPAGENTKERVRDVLMAAADRSEKARAQLVPPPLPDHLAYLWEWWIELHADVDGERITHRDLQAWAENTGIDPTPWEVATLLMMDRTYRMTLTATN